MTLKLFRAVWFLSVLVVLANLLYVYASLPEEVVVREQERLTVNRELLFYVLMGGILGVNLLVYLFKTLYQQGEDLRAWFHGLVITINLFMVISMHALNVYNSQELFDHSRVSVFLIASLGLTVVWAACWPVYRAYQKIFVKEAV